MAPRKTSNTPSDETAKVASEDTVNAVSGDDSLANDTATAADDTVEPPAEVGEDNVTTASDDTVSSDTDSIELAEPGRTDAEETPDEPVEDTPADGMTETASEDVADDADTMTEDTPDDAETAEEGTPTEEETPFEKEMREEEEWPDYGRDREPAPRKGGFVPLFLGGVAAAVLGFFVATLMSDDQNIAARLTEQQRAIDDLRAAEPASVDTTALEAATSENATALASLTTKVDELAAQITTMSERMAELEKAPPASGASDGAMKSYEDELARLQETMRTQRSEIEAMVTQAQQMSAAADAETAKTQARAALNRLITAMDNGQGFAAPLSDLRATGVQIPGPLIQNVDGIASLADLRASFPAAARDALAVTRGVGNDSVSGFFKTQLGIRSLEPKEGDDPDAVLSRAEAAVVDGNLSAALEEIATLPEEAQAELADWTAAAETRLATVSAAQGLMAELNSN